MQSSLSLVLLTVLSAGSPGAIHDPESRLARLHERIRQHPTDADLYLQRGRVFRQLQELPRAIADFERALALDPTLHTAHFARGRALLEAGRLDEAAASLDRCTAIEPTHGPALLARARVFARNDEYDKAAPLYDRSWRLLQRREPQHALERVRAWARTGERGVARAIRILDEASRELGGSTPLTTLAHAAAELEMQRGDLPAALQRLDALAKSLRATPAATGLVPTAAAQPVFATVTNLSPRGAFWRYLDDGSDQGTAWRQPGFDHSSWFVGQAELGYGDFDETTVVSFGPNANSKYITTYFRRSFDVVDPSALQRVCMRMLRDDGAAVYLNGIEIARGNLPAGALYTTPASSTVASTREEVYHYRSIDPALLVRGCNFLAVEVHQRSGTSSDLSFDLEVWATDGAPCVLREPYLQMVSSDGATVSWRTDAPSDSVVWFGSDPQNLNTMVSDPTPTIDHQVRVTGLDPDTTYYYAVGFGTTGLAGATSDHYFTTAPTPGTPKKTRVWVVGDSGTGNQNAARVRDAWLNHPGGGQADLWLMLGDNAYEVGLDIEHQAGVFDMYPMVLRNTCVWPTLGNHDAGVASSANESGPYYNVFSLPRAAEAGGVASGTEAYYSFDYGDAHFICLNSQDVNRATTGAMLTWLQADLAATTQRWIIAYWHHPPYTKGSHNSDNPADSGGRLFDMRQNALPILEAGGVDLVMTGHSHSYERSFLLDGHYDVSSTLTPSMILDKGNGRATGDGEYAKPSPAQAANEGAVYVVAGSSGKLSGGPLNHPAMHVSLNLFGSFILDIDGDTLTGTFLDDLGNAADRFDIVKGLDRSLTRDEPGISAITGGTQNLFLDEPSQADKNYQVVGSLSTSPGFTVHGVNFALNPDPYFRSTLLFSNTATYPGFGGVLDGAGQGNASIVFPAFNEPALVGAVFWHAFFTFDGPILFASNNVKLTLTL